MYDLICIGASWGGLDAVSRLLADLPAAVELPVVLAQHRSADSRDGALAQLLGTYGSRKVQDAVDKVALEPGNVYIAPPDYHLLVERVGAE